VVTGGAPVSRDNVRDFKKIAPNSEIWVLYGSTEVEPIAHIEAEQMINEKSQSDIDPELEDLGVNVGRIDSGLDFKFIEIDKNPISVSTQEELESLERPQGEVGELIVSGDHVCRDYYNDDKAFERAKILDEKGTVWHRTGDLGRLDPQGNLWLVGRIHNAINRDGVYFFPVQAENIMKKLDFVSRCAYLGVPDAKLGEKTVCVISPNEKARLDNEFMVSEIGRIMKKNKITFDQILLYNDIPLDSRHHSKVEYAILRRDLQKQGLV
jgi:acyl-CoA synthetase (AMP-forming)/AMP-acid ligase II